MTDVPYDPSPLEQLPISDILKLALEAIDDDSKGWSEIYKLANKLAAEKAKEHQ